MERALNPELLAIALGQHEDLPSSDDLAQLIADAELAILLHSPESSEQMDAVGWYLHAIASSKFALGAFGIERQRAAFQVAGHIFDLKLHTLEISDFDKLKYCFASQIAYARSTLDPNAIAIYKREFGTGLGEHQLIPDFQQVALACGISLLGFDVKYTFEITGRIKKEITSLIASWDVDNIESTIYGAVANVILGVRDLMTFLVYGRSEKLDSAREYFQIAITNEASLEDDISRWVAAHLLHFSDKLQSSSIWNVLPPEIPNDVRKAFINGNPPILTLWPPQIEFLGGDEENNPLSDQVKRLILSTPTSGGKTLLAQLLIAAHLATKQTSVCYVAPTRSLCREVRRSLQARLRFLGRQVIDGIPEGGWYDLILDEIQPEVEVMTPERLSYLIRTNSRKLLDQYGMFIFDEVHLVGDKGRGWTLEEDLSFLHYATEGSHHRLVLISAVLGNRNHFVQWVNTSTEHHLPLEFHRDWRGPRRIHAVWTTDAQWENSTIEPIPLGRIFHYRQITPLVGRLDARISQTGKTNTLYTTESIGQLVRKGVTDDSFTEKDRELSTPFYKMLLSIINFLAESGPVLIIESSKPATIRLAGAIADEQEQVTRPEILFLRDLIVARLGSDHPLLRIIEKGVAYHHGSLPSEIRNAIEDVVASGHIKFLVATTSLTEGVNLPVTSVVIASQGNYSDDGFIEFITGSKLINAIGRAGRATKETEGVVVLARQASPTDEDFNRLAPDESNLQVTSMLATTNALDELAAFEERLRNTQDTIFEAGGQIADFLKFIWFIASELELLNEAITIENIEEVLRHTLGWVQLTQPEKTRWLQITNELVNGYNQTPSNARRRWSSSGTSLGSARQIEGIAQSVIDDLGEQEPSQDIMDAMELIISNGRLEILLNLPEAPRRRFYTRRARGREEVPVPIDEMLTQWIQGESLIEISNNFLSGVEDIDYRYEQLGDFIYEYFEVFFPWVIGTIINWINVILAESGNLFSLPTTIPANIRYGVRNVTALNLMMMGIQSRSLAIRISEIWLSENQGGDIVTWIRSLTLSQWSSLFDPSPSEVRNLLEIARPQRGGVAVDLFKNGTTSLSVETELDEYPVTSAMLAPIEDTGLSPIGIWVGDQLVGKIFSKDQADIDYLQNSGLLAVIEFSSSSGTGNLRLEILEIE